MKRLLTAVLVLLFAACGVSGCGKAGSSVAQWFGAMDKPQPPAMTYDLLCDGSSGSTCSTETLRGALESVVRDAAARPGSVVRFWMQGTNIETTRIVAMATSPARYP